MSRTVIASIVVTVDGRTTGPAGPGDMSVIAPHGVTEQARDNLLRMTEATTALLGRKNYEGFHGWWPAVEHQADADPRDRAFSAWLTSVEKVVFSTTVDSVDWDNATLTRESPAAVVRHLKERPGGDIRVLSSGSLIRELLAAQLIDRMQLTLAPEIVGTGGTALFEETAAARSSWRTVTAEIADNGGVLLELDRIGLTEETTQ